MSDGQTTESSPPAKAALEELKLQAVRLRVGLASSDDLIRAADAALDAEVYAHGLAEVALFLENRSSDLPAPFLAAVKELGITLPADEDGMIWYLLRRYIGEVAAGTIEPQPGVARVIQEVDHHFRLFDKVRKYVGDSHGYQYIISLYYDYDEVRPDLRPEVFAEGDRLLLEACRDWMREFGGDE